MAVQKESLFRIFQADFRTALRRFFENRNDRITAEMAAELDDRAILERLLGLELLQYDGASNEYKLDDRIERFIEEMLGATEVAQADWLTAYLEDLRRLIEGHRKLAGSAKSGTFLRRIVRILRTCDSRAQRHLEDIKTVVDLDYRAGSDYQEKLLKLQWHLERARSFGEAVAELDGLLKNSAFFQAQQTMELLALRSRLIHRCEQVGDALIDIYQRIEEYLNRIVRDYARTRKLIQLRGLIERHEHLTTTNIAEVAMAAAGPWFRELRFRTLLVPAELDARPELLARVLAREDAAEIKRRRVRLEEHPAEEVPPVIDWEDVAQAFFRQSEDLFVFLHSVKVDSRPLNEEEVIDGFCAILSNDPDNQTWGARSFDHALVDGWEYAVVNPARDHP